MRQEARDRATETFVAVSDALRRSAAPVYMVKPPGVSLVRPSYLPPESRQTVGQYRMAISKLARLGIAKVN